MRLPSRRMSTAIATCVVLVLIGATTAWMRHRPEHQALPSSARIFTPPEGADTWYLTLEGRNMLPSAVFHVRGVVYSDRESPLGLYSTIEVGRRYIFHTSANVLTYVVSDGFNPQVSASPPVLPPGSHPMLTG